VLFNEIFYSSKKKKKKKLSQRVGLRPVHLKKKLFNFPILEIKNLLYKFFEIFVLISC